MIWAMQARGRKLGTREHLSLPPKRQAVMIYHQSNVLQALGNLLDVRVWGVGPHN